MGFLEAQLALDLLCLLPHPASNRSGIRYYSSDRQLDADSQRDPRKEHVATPGNVISGFSRS